MQKPRMTVNEVLKDMRSKGFSISPKTFNEGIEAGCFPFVSVLSQGEATGRKNLLIMRKDYEAWANEYLQS